MVLFDQSKSIISLTVILAKQDKQTIRNAEVCFMLNFNRPNTVNHRINRFKDVMSLFTSVSSVYHFMVDIKFDK